MHNAKVHSALSASSSYRWLACPGSIRLSDGLPKVSSVYAEEGTAAHMLGEACLKYNDDPLRHVSGILRVGRNAYDVTEEMAEAVKLYVDTVRADLAEAGKGAELKVEQQFRLDWLYPGLFGTNDASIGQPFGVLRIYDYKHGAGVAVDAEDNTQEMYYGLGAVGEDGNGYEEVELVIVQPRAIHPDGPVRRCRMTVDELQRWGKEVLLPGAKATEDPAAPLCAGEHCRFCPALAVCPEQKSKALAIAKEVFAPVPTAPPAPEALTLEDLRKVLDVSGMVSAWMEACRAHVRALLENGMATAEQLGYKLVHGRKTRNWTDEVKAEEVLGMLLDDAYAPRKLLSPAQAEKALGKDGAKQIQDLITESRGVQLAPLNDKREAVTPAIQAFTEVEDAT